MKQGLDGIPELPVLASNGQPTTGAPMEKTEDDYFRDWEGEVFGFGYGSGEPHVVPALKVFMAAIPERQYDYEALEAAVTPSVAWLLINALCRADIIEYGTSPRYGWLTPRGERLKAYIGGHSADDLVATVCEYDDGYVHCYPDHCNCDGPACDNPFWTSRRGGSAEGVAAPTHHEFREAK